MSAPWICARRVSGSTVRAAGKAVAPCLAAGLILFAALGPPAEAADQEVVRIDGISRKGLYRELFGLTRPAEIEIDVVGSGSRQTGALLAQAWILDLRSRRPAWAMDLSKCEPEGRKGNLRQREKALLPAGDYALYFSAHGDNLPLEKSISVLGLFKLGDFSLSRRFVEWNERGEPHDWRAVLRMDAPSAREAFVRLESDPGRTGELLRLGPLANGQVRRARLDLRAPLRARLTAAGEYSANCQGFADAAWICGRDSGGRIWELAFENTEHAGGAVKNRAFDRVIELSAGSYQIHCVADDSHAYGDWNATPPHDPESWGLALVPLEPLSADAARVEIDPPDENVVARIERVGDGEFHEVYFRLSRAADFFVRGLGEIDKRRDRYFDYGWIEDPLSLRAVWTMESSPGLYAGGECRNRLVEERVSLQPGLYRVCYASDDAHSSAGWSRQPPFMADAWGILVRGAGSGFDARSVRRIEPDELGVTRIAIAPVGNSEERSVRFEVRVPLTVRLTALGEGRRGEMFDFGWLENEETGAAVWTMEYADSRPAGGAIKNRRVERLLQLAPGRYALRYASDDSHAFGAWNEPAPDDPHLWGVTLVEVSEK